MINKTLNNIEDLIFTLNSLPSNYIYRGHSNSNWRLQSTLERTLVNNFHEKSLSFEEYSLNIFQNKFHIYNEKNRIPESKLEWLALMQHYGVPTRLLDFTESPYVALYFALENSEMKPETYFSIYAMDYRAILKSSIDFLNSKDRKNQLNYSDLETKKDAIFESIIDRFSYEILWITEPNFSNIRLDRQAGSFLLSGIPSASIENLLDNELYSEIPNYKYDVPLSLWEQCYTLLNRMNMNSKNIYGDVEGLAKNIKMFMKAYG